MINLTMDLRPIIQNNHAIGLIDMRDKTEYYFIKSIRKKPRYKLIHSVIYLSKSYPIKCLNRFYLILKHKNRISKISLNNTIYYITTNK